MEMIDIDQVRGETPGCEHVLHFNNAGAALMPKAVIEALEYYLKLEVYEGGYEAQSMEKERLTALYDSAAKLLRCTPEEIAFIENATRAWDMIFYSMRFKKGDKILTARSEYVSNYLAMLQMANKTGAVIEVIPDDESGQLSIEALKKMIDSKVRLVAITHVPMHGGLINPAKEVGKICKEAGVFYLLDATQSVGQMPVYVDEIQCDALCATGRKYLRGPRGTGFLYICKEKIEMLEPPFLDVCSASWLDTNKFEIQPNSRRYETWERSCCNKFGLRAAIDYLLTLGIEKIWERIRFLSTAFREELSIIPKVHVNDLGEEKCGIVTFTVENVSSEEIAAALRKEKINVSVALVEYARLDLQNRGLPNMIRASVHYYNTHDEIDRFCHILKKIISMGPIFKPV